MYSRPRTRPLVGSSRRTDSGVATHTTPPMHLGRRGSVAADRDAADAQRPRVDGREPRRLSTVSDPYASAAVLEPGGVVADPKHPLDPACPRVEQRDGPRLEARSPYGAVGPKHVECARPDRGDSPATGPQVHTHDVAGPVERHKCGIRVDGDTTCRGADADAAGDAPRCRVDCEEPAGRVDAYPESRPVSGCSTRLPPRDDDVRLVRDRGASGESHSDQGQRARDDRGQAHQPYYMP